MWVKINKIEQSDFNSNKLAFFTFNNREKYATISNTVLKYLNVAQLNVGDEIYVLKSFNKKDNEVYFIKNVKK